MQKCNLGNRNLEVSVLGLAPDDEVKMYLLVPGYFCREAWYRTRDLSSERFLSFLFPL